MTADQIEAIEWAHENEYEESYPISNLEIIVKDALDLAIETGRPVRTNCNGIEILYLQ